MTLAEIEKMSAKDRLQAMEALWDAMSAAPEPVDSPGRHEDILAARQARINEGRAEFISIEALKAGGDD